MGTGLIGIGVILLAFAAIAGASDLWWKYGRRHKAHRLQEQRRQERRRALRRQAHREAFMLDHDWHEEAATD